MGRLIQVLLLAAIIYWFGKRLLRWLEHAGGQRIPPPRPRAQDDPSGERPPWEVLGVSPNASQEEIRDAYQRVIQQYHPDRVAHMAPELRDLAERRTKEINAAYAALKRA